MGISEYLDDFASIHRSRSQATKKVSGGGHRLISNVPYYAFTSRAATGSAEETSSLNNPQWKYRKGKARDIGGPFFSRKVSVVSDGNVHSCRTVPGNVTGTYVYNGALYPGYGDLLHSRLATDIYDGKFRNSTTWTSNNSLSRGDLRAKGLKYMVAASPTSPAFDGANSLAELLAERSLFGIPFKQFARSGEGAAPGEYLNLQFGILPVISDVQDYLDASNHTYRIAAQLWADNGKIVRRERESPWINSTTSTVYAAGTNQSRLIAPPSTVLDSGFYRNHKLTVTVKTRRKTWFTGAYQYYLPIETEGFVRTLMNRNAVYGFLPSPSTIWELTPFSWLSDWATNTNDLVSSVFGAGPDASVLIRGYVMCESHITTEMTWTGDLAVNGSWKRVSMKWITSEVIKQRERTRPYGLDWKLTGLTDRQISILTALGLSRR